MSRTYRASKNSSRGKSKKQSARRERNALKRLYSLNNPKRNFASEEIDEWELDEYNAAVSTNKT